MILKEDLLKYGAERRNYKKGDFLFYEGEKARYYYQILKGELKMNNYNEKGNEFVQGMFKAGQSFGEPPLFIDEPYPANAEITKDAEVLLLPKSKFFELLDDFPIITMKLTKVLAQRLFYKSIIAVEMSSQTPEHRILSLLDYFKKQSHQGLPNDERVKFDITRQEIANLTGLRVETVIRAVKNLESKDEISLIYRKIWR